MKRGTRQPEPESEDPASEIAMTLQDVADYLNCHYSTVYRLAPKGKLPGFRLGGAWRCRRSELQAWMAPVRRGSRKQAFQGSWAGRGQGEEAYQPGSL